MKMNRGNRNLRFGVEILDQTYERADVLTAVEANIERYDIQEILFWGGLTVLQRDVVVPGFEKASVSQMSAQAARFRSWLDRYRRHDLLLVADGREPWAPGDFFEHYPEALCVSNGMFWEFLARRTEAILAKTPQLDRIEAHLWEAHLMGNDSFFPGMHWRDPDKSWTEQRFYEPVDYIVETISALTRGAERAGKEYGQKAFGIHKYQEDLFVEAVRRLPHDVKCRLSTQMQFGDFNPYMPPPAVIPANQTRGLTMYIDCYGEYLGKAQIPYCYPDLMQMRVQWGLEQSPAMDAVRGRVNFCDIGGHSPNAKTCHLFGTPNEVNLYALARLAEDPYVEMEGVWRDWASERYGRAVAPAVIEALRRSVEIVRNGLMFNGVFISTHSLVPGFDQAADRTAYARMKENRPDCVEEYGMAGQYVLDPNPFVLGELVDSMLAADGMIARSLADIESARGDLAAADYEDLKGRFEFARRTVAMNRLIGELSIRIRMRPERAPAANDDAINDALDGLREHARYAAAHYDEDCIVQKSAIENFIAGALAEQRKRSK